MQQELRRKERGGKAAVIESSNTLSSPKIVYQNANVVISTGSIFQLEEIPGGIVLFAGSTTVRVMLG